MKLGAMTLSPGVFQVFCRYKTIHSCRDGRRAENVGTSAVGMRNLLFRNGIVVVGVEGGVRVVVNVVSFNGAMVAILLRDGFHRAIQLVHGSGVSLRRLSRVVNGLYILEIGIMAERIRLQVIRKERRRVVLGGGPAGEGTVGGVSFAVLVVGELVGDAAAGLGWGEPADGQAQRMQVHVAHSFKLKAVGIHEGLGREGKRSQMCRVYLQMHVASF